MKKHKKKHMYEIENKYWFDTTDNREFLYQIMNNLLEFGKNFPSPSGAAYYMDGKGVPMKDRPRETWITARMAHVYSIATIRDSFVDTKVNPDDFPSNYEEYKVKCEFARDLATKAVNGLLTELKDEEHGGWYSGINADGSIIEGKECYAHAFVILAATSACLAEIQGAEQLLKEAIEVYDKYFWDEEYEMAVDTWDTEFKNLSDYRGLNANMHSVEAFLAYADYSGDETYRERAGKIISRVVKWALHNRYRIPEHFNDKWEPDLKFNENNKRDQFKPYGATPGHAMEWARLIIQWASSTYASYRFNLDAAGTFNEINFDAVSIEPSQRYNYHVEFAQKLYRTAMNDAWCINGKPGFVYTTGWNGKPIVKDRMHWTLAEAINTASVFCGLYSQSKYYLDYAEFMKYLDEKVLDHKDGSWFHQLDNNNELLQTVWPGKPDLYHAYQAMLIPYINNYYSIAKYEKSLEITLRRERELNRIGKGSTNNIFAARFF